ncbi:MAG: hypothetical protein JSS75_03330 [Bacteroidetes bacterium]|nr:hypothetical protein [Bacteroidota bacterium]
MADTLPLERCVEPACPILKVNILTRVIISVTSSTIEMKTRNQSPWGTFRQQLLGVAVAVLLIFSCAATQVVYCQSTNTTRAPRVITYQGSITADAGSPATGVHQVQTTLYFDPEGRQIAWSGQYLTTVVNGIFSLQLGSGIYPFSSGLDFSKQLWLGVSIDHSPEMKPLTPLSSSPYALSIPDQSVTAEKMQTDFVGAISVNGKQITGKASVLNLQDGQNTYFTYDSKTGSLSLNVLNGLGNNTPQWIAHQGCTTDQNDDNGETTNTISGGCGNTTVNGAGAPIFATIGGGQDNRAFGHRSTVGGGDTNFAQGNLSTIGGGFMNLASGEESVIAGGENNQVTAEEAAICGGGNNTASGFGAFIGGGAIDGPETANNSASGTNSAIGGGAQNHVVSNLSAITGGELNTVATGSDHGTIGGGKSNDIDTNAHHSFIGGGENNSTFAHHGVITGGEANSIQTTTVNTLDHSAIGGGSHNLISGTQASATVIGGGYYNSIQGNSFAATISGGAWNSINYRDTGSTDNTYSAIGGGFYDTIETSSSVIAGGYLNHTKGGATHRFATISGGAQNVTDAFSSSILGGNNNQTNSYGQAVVAYWDDIRVPTGATQFTGIDAPWQTNSDDYNGKLFIVGNGHLVDGVNDVRSNAFYVSYNGHSVVYDVNNTGAVRGAIKGGTYTDNVCYAWGDVTPTNLGNAAPLAPINYPRGVTNITDFGVDSVRETAPGTFTVYLHTTDQQCNRLNSWLGLAATATLVNTTCDAFISVTPVIANKFNIVVTQRNYTWNATHLCNGVTCDAWDYRFNFHVFGRPQ